MLLPSLLPINRQKSQKLSDLKAKSNNGSSNQLFSSSFQRFGCSLTSDDMKKIFPYHIVIDEKLTILQMGSKVSELLELNDVDLRFGNVSAPQYFQLNGLKCLTQPMYDNKSNWSILQEILTKNESLEEIIVSSTLNRQKTPRLPTHLKGPLHLLNSKGNTDEQRLKTKQFLILFQINQFVEMSDEKESSRSISTKRDSYYSSFSDDASIKTKSMQSSSKDLSNQVVQEMDPHHFVANVAHDLKTPLAAFLSGVETIDQLLDEMEKEHEEIQRLQVDQKIAEYLKGKRRRSSGNQSFSPRSRTPTVLNKKSPLWMNYKSVSEAASPRSTCSTVNTEENDHELNEEIKLQAMKTDLPNDQIIEETNHEILRSVNASMRDITVFMSMAINRCLDYTKAKQGLKLSPKYETIDLLETLSLPWHVMGSMQSKVGIELDAQIGFSARGQERDREEMTASMHEQQRLDQICSHIITDKQWLQENLLCLLSNAVKYSNGGTITVRLHLQDVQQLNTTDETGNRTLITAQQREAMLSQFTSNTNDKLDKFADVVEVLAQSLSKAPLLFFEVEDEGIGLSPAAMAVLFSPFKQAQRLAGGTGLGLFSLAKRVQALKGCYGVQTRRDGRPGSLFWFAIPYKPDSIAAQATLSSIISTEKNDLNIDAPNESVSAVLKVDLGLRINTSCDVKPVDEIKAESILAPIQANRENNNELPAKDCFVAVSALKRQQSKRIAVNTIDTSALLQQEGSGVETPSSLRILLVDDSISILKTTSMLLRKQGHVVEQAENGAEAIKKLRERLETRLEHHRQQLLQDREKAVSQSMSQSVSQSESKSSSVLESFDVILMDMQMPVIDGLEATRRLRELEESFLQHLPLQLQHSHADTNDADTNDGQDEDQERERPRGVLRGAGRGVRAQQLRHVVIAVSANSEAETVQEALSAGADDFLPKPFTIQAFKEVYCRVKQRDQQHER